VSEVNVDRLRELSGHLHLYWKVEDREVFRIIKEHLGDFDEYLQAVGRFVDSDL
jgi:uncharacterized protein YutE (UPF0331/DUF86 family)